MKCFNTYCASRCRTCHVIYVLRVCRSCASAVRPMGTVPVAKSACCVWGTCGRSAATVWVSTASLSPASRAQGRVHAQQSAWLYLCFKNKRHTCKMPLSNQLDSKAGEKSYTCISWRGSWQESEDSAGEIEDGSKPSVFLRTPNSELIFQKYLSSCYYCRLRRHNSW